MKQYFSVYCTGPDRYISVSVLSADIGLLQIYLHLCYVLYYVMLKLFLRPEKNELVTENDVIKARVDNTWKSS